MTVQKTLISIAAVGAAALLLVGCSAGGDSGSSNGSKSTPSSSAAAAKDAAPAAQPFNVGGLLAGNASPTYDAGDTGKVAVVSRGTLKKDMIGGAVLPIAYRNNTSKAIAHVDFTGAASAGGVLVGSGLSQGSTPAQVQPGEIGFAYIYFSDASSFPDTGVTYEFTVTNSPADKSPYNTAPLTVSQSSNNGTSIIGAAVNKTGAALTGPYSVDVYCFSGNDLADEIVDFADQSSDIPASGQVTFTVQLLDRACSSYAFGVSGYYK